MQNVFGLSMPVVTETKNSVFRQVHNANLAGNFHDNIVLAESGSDPVNTGNRFPYFGLQQNASATNNLLWARGLAGTGLANDDTAQIFNIAAITTATAQRNIILLNPAVTVTGYATYANLPGSVAGLSIDYNLVINTASGGFSTGGGTGNKLSWAAYQAAYPALDAHSMYVDLSADPRGIQAVFVDPLNGDFRWAQTDVARRCAAYCRANHVGPATVPSRWPLVPTVDEAVRLLTDL